MSLGFTSSELCQLLAAAFSFEGEDSDVPLRIAVKACLSEGVPVCQPLLELFQPPYDPADYPLRKSFRALARLDQLDALAVLHNHSSQPVRLAVIHAYYNFGKRAEVAALEEVLTDKDADVRTRAREAIEAILQPKNEPHPRQPVHDALSPAEYLVAGVMLKRPLDLVDAAPMARLLSANSRGMRELARRAFQLSDPDVADVLLESLEQVIASGEPMSKEAVSALQHLGNDGAVSLLIRALANQGEPSVDGPADVLAAWGPRVAPQLIEAFEKELSVRRRWGALLAKVAGPAALPALLAAFDSPYQAVRQSGAAGLIALGESSAPPLLARLDCSSAAESAEILDILGSVGSPDAFEAIARRTNDRDPAVRTAAIRALASFNTAVATEALVRAVGSPDWRIREAAVQVIGHWDWRNHDAVGLLSDAFHDPHPRVSAAARDSLAQLARGGSLMDHVEDLLQRLEHGDEAERTRARRELRNLRGVIAFDFARPRVCSPDGSRQWATLQSHIRAVTDLAPYESSAAAHARRPAAAAAGPSVPSQANELDTAEVPRAITDHVRFSVTCPITVIRQQPCLLDVWVHSVGDVETVLRYVRADPRARSGIALRSKGPVPVARGTTLVAKVAVPSLGWADEDSVYWSGTVGNATCSLVVPANASTGDHAGQAHIFAAGIQIARVSFLITVGSALGTVHDVTSRQHRVNSAFASYATEDRNEVLTRIQGMLSIVPSLDIFMDVMSLRSGERWEERVESEILNRDVLYLFWSAAARRSPWVDREWRIALQAKGLDGIDPVPLESPDTSPPPQELAGLHFTEWTLQVRRPQSTESQSS